MDILAPHSLPARLLPVCSLFAVTLLSSCGGSGSAASTTTTTTTTNAYATVYKAMTWATGVTVSFPSSCSMTVTASGTPPSHNAYYLAPATAGQTVVATTPSGIQLAMIAYAGTGISTVKAISGTFNICPTKASTTTAATGGAIGVIASGEALFDAYEATGTVAVSDNASYTFTSAGTSYTAYFIDQCNSHAAGGMGGGSTWHYHGNPVCYTATVDGASGPSHIIGIALDGFPIYGGRDISGNAIDPATLDACNGITSVTPEFATATYHYVLPIGVTTKQSSINCYAGTVGATLSAAMQKLGCMTPFLLANGKARLPDGREVSRGEAAAWVRQTMPGMMAPDAMPGMQMAAKPDAPAGKQRMRMSGM